MQRLGLCGNQPGSNTSKPHPQHAKFPYLPRGFTIKGPTQVWITDITYIRLRSSFVYLVAVMGLVQVDWVMSYRLSNSLETAFCLESLEEAIASYGKPEIFYTVQAVQFTSEEFVNSGLGKNIRFSMDGRERALKIFSSKGSGDLRNMKKYTCRSTKMFKKRGQSLGITSIFTIRKGFVKPLDIKRPKRFILETCKNQNINMDRAQSSLPCAALLRQRLRKPEVLLEKS